MALVASCDERPNRSPGDTTDAPHDTGAPHDEGAGSADGPVDLSAPDHGDAVSPDLTAVDLPPPPVSEFLLFDGDNRQFTVADNGFHPLIQPGDPLPLGDWSNPEDFYSGEFHIRYVINEPANQQPGKLQVCIWTMGNADGDGKDYFPESCSDQVSHNGVGTYTNANLVPASWWKKDGVPLVFSHPERFLIRVVLRGISGCNVTTYNVSNGCWSEWPNFKDMKFRVTIVMVAQGATFSGWPSYP
jgi:hypothetical protein